MKVRFSPSQIRWLLTASLCAAGCLTALNLQAQEKTQWTYWRGTEGSGVAPEGKYPVRWTEDGFAWKKTLEGHGGSTPIVANDKVFVTLGAENQNRLMAADLETGKTLWQATLGEDTGGTHRKGSGSNPSPTTDGENVFAYYRSGDLGCVNMEGEVIWKKNLQKEFGSDTLWWDLGSSPVLVGDMIVVAVMQSPPSPSYIAAFSKSSGDLIWKVERELDAPREAAQSYTSPVVAEVGERTVIGVLGADHLTVHDARNGQELGRLGGLNPTGDEFFRSISSPVVDGEIIICPYSRGATLTAVDMAKLIDGAGDDAILWHRDVLKADVPTPSLVDGVVYLCSDKGEVQAINARTGETTWTVELPRHRLDYSSSPLVTSTHIYLTREDGTVFVVKLPSDSDPAAVVAENNLADDGPFTVASPIPAGDALVFRTPGTLLKINADTKAKSDSAGGE